jgi:hypothetical protein
VKVYLRAELGDVYFAGEHAATTTTTTTTTTSVKFATIMDVLVI